MIDMKVYVWIEKWILSNWLIIYCILSMSSSNKEDTLYSFCADFTPYIYYKSMLSIDFNLHLFRAKYIHSDRIDQNIKEGWALNCSLM